MHIADVMTRHAKFVNEKATVAEAARMMRDDDLGFVPVERDDKMIGVLTDRDIAVRVVAEGASPESATAGSAMSDDVYYCFEDQPVDDVVKAMQDKQVRRVPVVNRDKRLVGIVSLGDLATRVGSQEQTLAEVSQEK